MTNKSLLLACSAAMAAIGLAVIAAGNVLVRSFDSIEIEQSAAKAEQVLGALEADLNQLAAVNRDYAEWDTAADYIASKDREFIDSNFAYSAMVDLHIDSEWLIAADGTEIQSRSLDKLNKQILQPAPRELLAAIDLHLKDLNALRAIPSTGRIVATPDGLVAFSAVEVARTDRSHPTGAKLVFARRIDQDVLTRLQRASGVPLSVQVVAGPLDTVVPAGSNTIQLPALPGLTIYVAAVDDNRIDSYFTIENMNGEAIGLFHTTSARSIGAIGRRTTMSLMATLIGLVVAAGIGIVMLLARLQRSALANQAAKRRHDNIVSQVSEGIVLAHPDGAIIEANDAAHNLLGYSDEALKHAGLREIFLDLPETVDLLAAQDKGKLRECRLRAADGRLIDAEVTVSTIVDNGTQLLCIMTRDLRVRRQLEQQEHANNRKLARLSQTDALTGLPNRVYLHKQLPKLLQETAQAESLLSLLYIDIDQFKHINESRGHASGDNLIQVIAKRLRSSIAAEDILVRMGGDEFVIVTSLMPNLAAVTLVAKRLIECVQAPIELQGTAITVTASIGIGIYPTDSIDMETLLKHADIALYQAKEKGRNTFCLFSPDMNVQLSEHVALEQELRRAIGTDQLFVEYQPVVDVYTGQLVSFEALARWLHPIQGLIPPIRFIPVAEKSGLIKELGEDVLRKVVMQQRKWLDDNVPLAPVAINVSPLQLERTDFAILVHELCLEHGLDPKWLHFEVTESSWMQESNKHIVALDTLRSQGSKISIDDFGTGFSNLSYLKQLPVDTLKIDRAFIQNIHTDSSDAAIVKSILAIAKNLHLDVVAEGVETIEHLELLRSFGCHKAQGYYFSKPIPGHLCRALLQQLGESRRLTDTVKIRAFKTR